MPGAGWLRGNEETTKRQRRGDGQADGRAGGQIDGKRERKRKREKETESGYEEARNVPAAMPRHVVAGK